MTTSPIDEHVHELGMPAFDQRIADAVARSVELGGEKQTQLKGKDLKTDQEVRWCPGCGDYVILNAVQSFLPSSASPARTWSSCPGSAAPAASRTT